MFKNLEYGAENVWVGAVTFKFYHPQKHPHCGFAGKGYTDLKSEGPWNFTCHKCNGEWSVSLGNKAKNDRLRLLLLLKRIDEKISHVKSLGRRYDKI